MTTEMITDCDWISVEDKMPEVGQRVEYYFQPHLDFTIHESGYFKGYYTDSKGVEWDDMHVFVSDDGSSWLTGDVTHWKPMEKNDV